MEKVPLLYPQVGHRIHKRFMKHQIFATQYQITEWLYRTTKSYSDSFNDIDVFIILTPSDGQSWRFPAYLAGRNEWCVRFAPPRRVTIQESF